VGPRRLIESTAGMEPPLTHLPSGVCETRLVGLSGPLPGLVSSVAFVTHLASGRVLCALRMNRPSVRGDAGLAPAVGLIRRLSALSGVTRHRLAARFSLHPDRHLPDPTSRAGGSDGMLADEVDYVIGG
jgi:hypothetical protein